MHLLKILNKRTYKLVIAIEFESKEQAFAVAHASLNSNPGKFSYVVVSNS